LFSSGYRGRVAAIASLLYISNALVE